MRLNPEQFITKLRNDEGIIVTPGAPSSPPTADTASG
jgi:hypothetical protein